MAFYFEIIVVFSRIQVIKSLRSHINNAYAKRNEIGNFVNTTRGIYDRAGDINRILKRADTELNKVQYNPKSMTLDFSSVNRDWLLEMEELRVFEQLKADGMTDEDFRVLSELGFTVEQISAAWEGMKGQGISRADLKDMKTLGYSFARTIEMWSSLETKEDKHFFTCLIIGGEEKCLEAFGIDPNDLSDNMTIAMAEYASRLLEHGKDEALITLNNALLRSDKIFYDVMPDGTKIESLQVYRDVYLERMYAGTAVLLQADTVLLAAMEAEIHKTGAIPDGYEALNQKHMQEMNMCGYWAAQSILIHRQGTHTEDNQFRIEAIGNKGGQGGIDYNLGYFSPWNGCWESVRVDNTIVNEIQMNDKWALEELKSLEKARENLVANFVVKTVEGVATVAVGYAAPEVAILVTAALIIKNGAAGTVRGLDQLTSNELGKLAIKGGNVAAQNMINYAIQLSALESSMSAKEHKTMMTWFGKGSAYDTGEETGITFAGFYNPKALYALERLETEGLGEMAGWSKEQITSLKGEISEDEILKKKDEVRIICEELINGGYQLVDGDYKANNIIEFGDALDNLDRIIANRPDISLPGSIHKDLFRY